MGGDKAGIFIRIGFNVRCAANPDFLRISHFQKIQTALAVAPGDGIFGFGMKMKLILKKSVLGKHASSGQRKTAD